MGMYKDMVLAAKESGKTDEKVMWSEIDNVDELLDMVKEQHPEEYWRFIRNTHESIYGCHYDEVFATYDVDKLRYTDMNGVPQHGAHWTLNQILEATMAKQFPSDVTDWDKYVAFNAMYSDLCRSFSDEDIIKAGYLFFFADEDWCESGSSTKIWEYMNI